MRRTRGTGFQWIACACALALALCAAGAQAGEAVVDSGVDLTNDGDSNGNWTRTGADADAQVVVETTADAPDIAIGDVITDLIVRSGHTASNTNGGNATPAPTVDVAFDGVEVTVEDGGTIHNDIAGQAAVRFNTDTVGTLTVTGGSVNAPGAGEDAVLALGNAHNTVQLMDASIDGDIDLSGDATGMDEVILRGGTTMTGDISVVDNANSATIDLDDSTLDGNINIGMSAPGAGGFHSVSIQDSTVTNGTVLAANQQGAYSVGIGNSTLTDGNLDFSASTAGTAVTIENGSTVGDGLGTAIALGTSGGENALSVSESTLQGDLTAGDAGLIKLSESTLTGDLTVTDVTDAGSLSGSLIIQDSDVQGAGGVAVANAVTSATIVRSTLTGAFTVGAGGTSEATIQDSTIGGAVTMSGANDTLSVTGGSTVPSIDLTAAAGNTLTLSDSTVTGNAAGGETTTLQGSGTGSIGGDLLGNGDGTAWAVTKSGSGAWGVTGNLGDADLATLDVTGGTLTIGGALTGNSLDPNITGGVLTINGTAAVDQVNIGAGGVLAGTGVVTNTSVLTAVAGGAIRPGDTLEVQGNLDLQGDSELQVDMGTATSTLLVTGGSTVEFGSDGSAPIIGVRADGYVADGQRDVVVDATAGLMTLTTAPELADNETAVLSFALDFTGNEIYVVANRKSYVEAMAGAGGPNAEAVAKTLDEARATATGDAASVLTRLDNLDSAEELGRALDSLTPEANHATVEAGLGATQAFEGGQVGRVAELKQLVGLQGIRVRVPQKAAPRGPGGPPFGTRTDIRLPQSPNVWAHGIGSWGDQDSRDGHLGWTYDTYGVVTGADHEFGNTIAGLSLGVADTDIESDRQGNHSEIASFHLGAYAVHALPEGVYVDGGLHYSRHWIDTYRSVFPFRQAEGETNADALGFHVGVSKDHQLGEWVVSPEGRIAYGYYAQDGYTEEGAGAMNLTVDNFNRHSFRTKLGVEATTGIHEYVSFNAHAYWTHEWCDNQASMQARFNDVTGSSWFDTDGLDPANANFNLGFGFNAQVSEEHLLYLTYDCDLRRDFTAHTVMLGVRCAF